MRQAEKVFLLLRKRVVPGGVGVLFKRNKGHSPKKTSSPHVL